MSHQVEIAVYNVKDGEAWHKIGKPLQGMGTFEHDVLEAREVEPTLMSDYEIVRLSAGEYGHHPTQGAVVRKADGRVCGGTVGLDSYSLSQPWDQVALARRILDGVDGVRLSFMAHLAGGARMLQTWNLGDFDIAGEHHQRYLCIHTGFDGSYSTEILLSAIRTVCNNTLSSARYDACSAGDEDGKRYDRIKRTVNAPAREDKAIGHHRRILAAFDKLKGWSESLTKIRVTHDDAVAIVCDVLKRRGQDPAKSKRAQSTAAAMVDSYLHGAGNAPWVGTAYGVWQGLTEYACHRSIIRGVRDSDGIHDFTDHGKLAALDSSIFGTGSDIRETARAVMDDLLGRQPPTQATVDAQELMASLRTA